MRGHHILLAVSLGLALWGMNDQSHAQIVITEEQKAAAYTLDPLDLSAPDQERFARTVRLVQRAMGLREYCNPEGRLPRRECKVSILIVPGPVGTVDGARICGLYSPEIPGTVVVVVGGLHCAQAVGDRKFFGTLAHEYAHRLQWATDRHQSSYCPREWMETEAHAIGELVDPDQNNAMATIMYARQCLDKRGAK